MNSIYLADIDPNNVIISPMEIRRIFMYRLLIWDSIVLSDSQLLTDPRINLMMAGFDSKNLAKKLEMEDISDFHRGFEQLADNKFIEVASRKNNHKKYTLNRLYDEMTHRTSRVPYLPGDEDYSKYLDSLNLKERLYDLDSIGARFQKNLLAGIGSDRFPNTTYIENELSELFKEDKINFSKILDLLKLRLNNEKITLEEYNRIYEYVYSCYSINISKETGCYISTKFKDIPLHLGCGVGDFEETIKQKDVDNIRSTWALNPAILDCISFKDFVSIKKKLMNIPYRSLIMEFLNGTLKEDNLDLFYSAWENYTMCLEEMMRESLMKSQVQIYEKLMELSSVKLKHRTVLSESWEVVESLIERAPIVGDVLGVTDMGNTLLNCIRNISHKEEWNRLIDRKEDISKLLSPDTKIITKY